MRVRLTKFNQSPQANFKAGDLATYVAGSVNPGVSIPIDYYLEGEIQEKPVIGNTIIVYRDSRNGIKEIGLFRSSPITSIDGALVQTENSVYSLEYI